MNKRLMYIASSIVLVAVAVVIFMMTGDHKTQAETPLKEFTVKSFVEFVNGQPRPQFDVKEITVNKGDRVKMKVTVTAGTHNFRIDEYGIAADTPLNREVVVEFVADKAGEFVYYCAMPGHRQNGHWGTLKVLES